LDDVPVPNTYVRSAANLIRTCSSKKTAENGGLSVIFLKIFFGIVTYVIFRDAAYVKIFTE